MPRAFTHAAIVAFFHEVYGQNENPRYTVEQVKLLLDLPVPMWEVKYSAAWTHVPSCNYHSRLLIIQKQYTTSREPYLMFVTKVDLPSDLTTPEDEDREMARREREQEEKWMQESKQRAAQAATAESEA